MKLTANSPHNLQNFPATHRTICLFRQLQNRIICRIIPRLLNGVSGIYAYKKCTTILIPADVIYFCSISSLGVIDTLCCLAAHTLMQCASACLLNLEHVMSPNVIWPAPKGTKRHTSILSKWSGIVSHTSRVLVQITSGYFSSDVPFYNIYL